MKNSIILSIAYFFIGTSLLFAQQDYGNYENYSLHDMDYIKDGKIENYRVRKKGDRAIGLYYYVPFDWSSVNPDIITDSNTIVDNKHRVTEKLIPNYKYYLSDKSNLVFGLYMKRTKVKYQGDIDVSVTPSLILTEKEIFNQNGLYGRIGYEHHLAQPSYRLFDLDFYGGAAISFGLAPTSNTIRQDFVNGDYTQTIEKSNVVGLGMDLYTGVNFQFDNFSAGVELIALGFDSNSGVGKSRMLSESSIGGTVTAEEYLTYDNSSYAYSNLKLSRNLTSMYRGIRFSACYYF